MDIHKVQVTSICKTSSPPAKAGVQTKFIHFKRLDSGSEAGMTEKRIASVYLADQLGSYNLCFLDNRKTQFIERNARRFAKIQTVANGLRDLSSFLSQKISPFGSAAANSCAQFDSCNIHARPTIRFIALAD